MIQDAFRQGPRAPRAESGRFVRQPGPKANIDGIRGIATILIGVGSVVLLSTANRWIPVYAVATIALVLLFYGMRYALEHPHWFIFALIVEETVPYFSIIPLDPDTRWFLRYPLLFPLALPALWGAIRTRIIFQGRFGLMLIFFAWAAVTLVYSLNPAVSAGRLIPDFLLFATICFAAAKIESADDVQHVLGRFVLGCGLLQIITAFAYLFLPEVLGGSGETLRATWMVDERGLYRFCGVFNEPNAVGSLMLATVGSGVAHWHAVTTRSRKLLLALSMTAAVIFAVFADSRSETFAAVIGCVSYGIWKYRWKGIVAVALVIVLALGCFSMFGSLIEPYLNRGVDTMTGRTEAWAFEISKAEDSPLLGYGYQSEGEILRDRHFKDWEEIWNRGAGTPLHNGYMTLIIGTGVPATIFWLAVFIGPWWSLFRSRDDPWNLMPLALLVILPMLLLSIDESGLSEPRYVRGLLMFMSWAMAERYQIVHRLQTEALEKQPASRWQLLFASNR
jgi:O-antigen ligase